VTLSWCKLGVCPEGFSLGNVCGAILVCEGMPGGFSNEKCLGGMCRKISRVGGGEA